MSKEERRAYEKDINQRLGRRIRVLRKQHGMSQHDIGDFLGVSAQQVQKWEAGINRLSAARLRMLCFLFDIRLDQFFFDKGTVDASYSHNTISEQ